MSGNHFNWDHRDNDNKDRERFFHEIMKMTSNAQASMKETLDIVQNYMPTPQEFADVMLLQKLISKEDPAEKAIIKRIIIGTIYKTTADMVKKIIDEKLPLENIITQMPDADGFGACVFINSSVDPEMSEFVKSAFIMLKQQTGDILLSVLHGKGSETSREIITAEMAKLKEYIENPQKFRKLPDKSAMLQEKVIDIDDKSDGDTLTADEAKAFADKVLKDMGF
jgi:hypothetical protein